MRSLETLGRALIGWVVLVVLLLTFHHPEQGRAAQHLKLVAGHGVSVISPIAPAPSQPSL